MNINYYVGIDRGRPAVSKATLEWAVFGGKSIVLQTQSPNSETGIRAAVKLVKALPEFTPVNSIACLEHTGIYNAIILSQLAIFSFPT